MLQTLLSAILCAAAEEKLAKEAVPFARHICRHFAMLFVAGAQPPPPAPIMFRQEAPRPSPNENGSRGGRQGTPAQTQPITPQVGRGAEDAQGLEMRCRG